MSDYVSDYQHLDSCVACDRERDRLLREQDVIRAARRRATIGKRRDEAQRLLLAEDDLASRLRLVKARKRALAEDERREMDECVVRAARQILDRETRERVWERAHELRGAALRCADGNPNETESAA